MIAMRGRFKQIGFVLLVSSLCGCKAEQSLQDTENPDVVPFATIQDDVARHELFRNVQFEDVTKTMPSGSVDHIDFDMTHEEIVVARVTAKSSGPDVRFETAFRSDDGTTVTKEWSPADGSGKDVATGLFIVPSAVTSASTRLAPQRTNN